MRAFLSAMLERKEERRATAKHLLNHPFIQENVLAAAAAAATDASPDFPDYKKYINSCLSLLFANPIGPPSRRP